jgi:signal transduction histidine kinase
MAAPIDSGWERWGLMLSRWFPYLSLALSLVLTLPQPSQTPSDRVEILLLAAIGTIWVYLLYTRGPDPRRADRVRMLVYFVGLIAIFAALLVHHPFFFVFAITGFIHAADLRPWALTILGVGATSTIIQTATTGFPWPTFEIAAIFVTVIVIQTLVIGLGIVAEGKLSEVSQQRKDALAKLEAALEENVGLHAQLVAQAREAGVLDERQRMAREIHDTIAQGLTGIVTQLEAAGQAKDRPEDWRRHLDNAARLARDSLSEARRSVEGSRPGPLEAAALPEALAAVAREWSAVHGVPVEVTTTGERVPLHPEIEVALLRTAQEALANVAKHAAATRAGLTLSYMGDEVTLDVRDDGVGFVVSDGPSAARKGFGLTVMRQRVGRVAGSLAIESEVGGGTAISARVPAIAAHRVPEA